MEDSIVAMQKEDTCVLAVFDGHAGCRASRLAATYLADNINQFVGINEVSDMKCKLIAMFVEMNNFLAQK